MLPLLYHLPNGGVYPCFPTILVGNLAISLLVEYDTRMTIFFNVEALPTDAYRFHCYPAGGDYAVAYGPYDSKAEAERVAAAHLGMCEDCQLYGEIQPMPVEDVEESAYLGSSTDALLFYLLRLNGTQTYGQLDAETLLGKVLFILGLGLSQSYVITGAGNVFAEDYLESEEVQTELLHDLCRLADIASTAYRLNRSVVWC